MPRLKKEKEPKSKPKSGRGTGTGSGLGSGSGSGSRSGSGSGTGNIRPSNISSSSSRMRSSHTPFPNPITNSVTGLRANRTALPAISPNRAGRSLPPIRDHFPGNFPTQQPTIQWSEGPITHGVPRVPLATVRNPGYDPKSEWISNIFSCKPLGTLGTTGVPAANKTRFPLNSSLVVQGLLGNWE
ncbi:hypothetical protein O1611_g2161 [Lasiodiplodia mahajangana]|uniref:Uncharacterized protein n=1 Tax=Lasiodiplodia mahajangana TaxID=1108764 RepID=A0ACC2JVC3_9PEZI|nr:hypothetical protein O1611_g2161 [Lasiodiplodia mahajangana]